MEAALARNIVNAKRIRKTDRFLSFFSCFNSFFSWYFLKFLYISVKLRSSSFVESTVIFKIIINNFIGSHLSSWCSKSRWKNRVICLVWVGGRVYKVMCLFCNFLLMSAKKSKVVKAIYVNATERSRFVLLENSIVYYTMT